MPDIKTRDMVKGTIKTINKSAVAAERMKSAFIQTKEKAEHSTHAQESSAEEYASNRIEGGADRITHEAARQFDKQGRKGLETTKQNISKAKDGIQKFKEKRAAQSLEKQSIRTPRNKGVKAVQETKKTVKQSARSAGKKTIKTVGRGSAKTAQKTVKTAERTAKTAVKTTQQAAKAAQKTAQATVKATQRAIQAARATAKAVESRRKSDDCGSQGDYCRHKSIGRRYCCRRVGCGCCDYCDLSDWSASRFCIWDLLFGRRFRHRYDNADRSAGDQFRLRC